MSESIKIILKFGIAPCVFLLFFWLFFSPSPQVGYAPEQPIPYSHKLHAGELNIDCQYCHSGVTFSKKAGIPSISTCMNCHASIGYGNKQVEKLQKMWSEQQSPEWVRVHNMPDHVRFSHAPHIKLLLKEGEPTKTACIQCHGDLSKMEVVEQVESLNMGFCVQCHRDNQVKPDTRASASRKQVTWGGAKTDCTTCHY